FNAFENTLKKYKRPYVLLKGDKKTRLKIAVEAIDKILETRADLYRFSDDLIDLDLHFLHHNTSSENNFNE
ncbi:MAG: nicotinate-nucleotide adenylyltransferase, partial [Flavobacteriaceae bacterium]|nr:nicotinate-nucleotide adenylyltransferase [Flavobacteriaceae bacterium]